jgi:hypothetical protein
MGELLRFNNKLSFLKSVITLIDILRFSLGITNDGEAYSEE